MSKKKEMQYGTAGINIKDIACRNNAIGEQKLP